MSNVNNIIKESIDRDPISLKESVEKELSARLREKLEEKKAEFYDDEDLEENNKGGYYFWDTSDGSLYPEGGRFLSYKEISKIDTSDFYDGEDVDDSLAIGYHDGKDFWTVDSKGNKKRKLKENLDESMLSEDAKKIASEAEKVMMKTDLDLNDAILRVLSDDPYQPKSDKEKRKLMKQAIKIVHNK